MKNTILLNESIKRHLKDFIVTPFERIRRNTWPYGFGVSKEDYRILDFTEPSGSSEFWKKRRFPSLTSPWAPLLQSPCESTYDSGIYASRASRKRVERLIRGILLKEPTRIWRSCPPDILGCGTARMSVPGIGTRSCGFYRFEGKPCLPGYGKDILFEGEMDRKKCCITAANVRSL